MFGIDSAVSFYGKMLEDYDDFVEQPGSPRHAINCMLSAYHIAEWIWGDWLQTDYVTWTALGIRDKPSFLAWVDQAQPWFRITQAVANGSKHFASKLAKTKSSPTYAQDGYVEDGYQERMLEVEVEDGRWIEAVIVVEEVVMFWSDFLKQYGPQNELPQPRNPFTSMAD
ncbi:hypothetical protein [Bradyrhizobium sp. 131]|uniref:hypothetical protein n=1 Tax=Bradyrhizobium sp. 131 TaxID=2782609 RepID=UPI001FFEB419|nr:hypothetical protein [Bradyrhizobium sp. 131]UPK23443.1 hypothetical protein IVA73_38235 [Bradyrhizobium sp. 131]